MLDVRPRSYFAERGFQDQHAGGQAFDREEAVMGWLFGKTRSAALAGIPKEPAYIRQRVHS